MSKKIIAFFFFIISFFILNSSVSAHPAGLPPFFKANGQFSRYYHVPLQSDIIDLPQDDIDGTFITNTPITFEIDPNLLPFPKNMVNSLKYTWDFGDGEKGDGFKNVHTFKKPGSYIVKLNAEPKPTYVTQTYLESVLINVLPDSNYSLVIPTIIINGYEIKDSITDTFEDDIGTKELKFEAKVDNAVVKNAQYFWDFGDETKGKGQTVTHKYTPQDTVIFVILRVITEDGFIRDTFAEIHNSKIILTKNGGISPKTSTRLIITPQPQTNFIAKKISDISYSMVRYVAQPTGGILFLALAVVVIFLGGGLHALTPGHGKSMMAAFLLGKHKSSLADVFLLALSITLTHILVIFILGFIFLFIDKAGTVGTAVPFFEKASAILVVILALGLIRNGINNWKHEKNHSNGDQHHHDHNQPITHIQNRKQLFFAGFSGGVLPCTDALSLLLLCISLGRVAYGIFLTFIFSLGLATVIVLLGLLLITGKEKFNFEKRFGKFAYIGGPIFSGIVILLIGLRLLLK